mgnify:CR=1 FL=1
MRPRVHAWIRDDLARGRQQLLATTIMMGINRIIITDGRINAKLKFNFSAQDTMNRTGTVAETLNGRTVVANESLALMPEGVRLFVLAHELGHFKHKHVTKRIVMMFGLSLAGLALLGWLAAWPAFYTGLGVAPNLRAPNHALALMLFLMAVPVFGFFISPLTALLSRRHEFEADAYACAQSSGSDLRSALLKLHEDNASTLTPDPVYVRFYYSHPPASERLAALALRAA